MPPLHLTKQTARACQSLERQKGKKTHGHLRTNSQCVIMETGTSEMIKLGLSWRKKKHNQLPEFPLSQQQWVRESILFLSTHSLRDRATEQHPNIHMPSIRLFPLSHSFLMIQNEVSLWTLTLSLQLPTRSTDYLQIFAYCTHWPARTRCHSTLGMESRGLSFPSYTSTDSSLPFAHTVSPV